MLNGHFGITHLPFSNKDIELLSRQRDILETLKAHSYQRGLCLVAGQPGTGKSVLRQAYAQSSPHQVSPHIGRTLHTYSNTLRILCESLGITYEGGDLKCEKGVIQEAFRLNQSGKAIALTIDDAHLLDLAHLRKLRLLFEEMPNNYAIVLFGQIELMAKLSLGVNADLRSRVSYSAILQPLAPDDIEALILSQCDRVGLAHHRLDPAARRLIAASSDGILRHTANLTLASMTQALRAQVPNVTTEHVNAALMQPHWRDSEHWLSHPNG